jgi:hypothetical protein
VQLTVFFPLLIVIVYAPFGRFETPLTAVGQKIVKVIGSGGIGIGVGFGVGVGVGITTATKLDGRLVPV